MVRKRWQRHFWNSYEALAPTNYAQTYGVFSASPKVFSPSPPSICKGTLPQPLSTLSTEMLAYPGGTGRLWILGVLVRSIGLTTLIATFFVAFPSGMCSSQVVKAYVTLSIGKCSFVSSWMVGTSVDAQLLFNWPGGLMLTSGCDVPCPFVIWLSASYTCLLISTCILLHEISHALVTA